MFQVPVLFIALLLSSPALWQALVDGSMSVETALIRFLIAMPVAAVMVFAFRVATSSRPRAPREPRATDDTMSASDHQA